MHEVPSKFAVRDVLSRKLATAYAAAVVVNGGSPVTLAYNVDLDDAASGYTGIKKMVELILAFH
jgi:hypothetical protein